MPDDQVELDAISVRSVGEQVVVLKNGLLIAEMHWNHAEQLGKALIAKAQDAEQEHWKRVTKKLGHESPVKRILGVPVITQADELERM